MAPTYVNKIDLALKAGSFLQPRLIQPIKALREVFELMGRTTTNFGSHQRFELHKPILFCKFSKALLVRLMGENEAMRKWEYQTILMSPTIMTKNTLANLSRTVSIDLSKDFPGLDACTEAARTFWEEQCKRAHKEGFVSLEAELEKRDDIDDTVKRRILEYLLRAEVRQAVIFNPKNCFTDSRSRAHRQLDVADFGSDEYSEEELNAASPVIRGEAHRCSLKHFVEHLKLCAKRIEDVGAQKKALKAIANLPKTESEWLEIAKKEKPEAADEPEVKAPADGNAKSTAGNAKSTAAAAAKPAAAAAKSAVKPKPKADSSGPSSSNAPSKKRKASTADDGNAQKAKKPRTSASGEKSDLAKKNKNKGVGGVVAMLDLTETHDDSPSSEEEQVRVRKGKGKAKAIIKDDEDDQLNEEDQLEEEDEPLKPLDLNINGEGRA